MKIRELLPEGLPEKCSEARLTKRLNELKNDIYTRGIRHQDGRDVVTGYAYHELYDWDMYFENLFLSYLGESKYARNGTEMFLDTEAPSGFISRTMGLVWPKPRHQFKPFLAQTALLNCRQNNDFRWVSGKYYDKLEKYLFYWFRHCDADKNGLCFWDGSDHSGMDNQVLRLGHIDVMEFEGVDLNVYLVRELQSMAEIAMELGRKDDEEKYRKHAEALAKKIDETFWDEETGFYYDRSEITGKLNKVRCITGFLPMWLGTIPKERALRMVKEHLMNPEEFWLDYPVATWAKNEPGYYQERKGGECTWMGATWIPTNYMILHGLMNYGFEKEAKMLADKTLAMVLLEDTTREYYNAETGVGQGMCPFWGWSSLGYVMSYEAEKGYDPTNVFCNKFLTIDELDVNR